MRRTEATGGRYAYRLSDRSTTRFVEATCTRLHYMLEDRGSRVVIVECKCLGHRAPSWRLTRLGERLNGDHLRGEPVQSILHLLEQ